MKSSKGQIKSKLNLFPSITVIAKKIHTLKENENKAKKPNPSKIISNKLDVFIKKIFVELEWEMITFWDQCIKVQHCGIWHSVAVKESQKYLNAIKCIYKFKNAPKLYLEINKNSWRVTNSEVLLYYIKYLEHANNIIFKEYKISFENAQSHTKGYFLKHLPNLFKQESLTYLCEIIPDNFKLIHVPEVVKDSSGNIVIHDSFLFPVPHKSKILWVWESNIDSKASYLFETSLNDDDAEIKHIYNFITGDVTNKRMTLIHSNQLRNELNCKHRVIHNNFETWKSDITKILKIN